MLLHDSIFSNIGASTKPGAVHFHGARFEVHTACMYREEDFGKANGHGPVMVAHARWLDGAVVSNYFGPGKDWNFQGNKLASAHIECQ